MPTFSLNHSAETFRELLADSDENTKAMAFALESFVDSVLDDDHHTMFKAWKEFHSAIEERIEKRVQLEITKLLSGKQLDAQLREYLYKESEGVKE